MPALESLLDDLGLSKYEKNAYRVLFNIRRASASEIASKSKVPQAKIYEVLKSLEGKGLVSQELSKTKTYVLNDPASSFATILNQREAHLKELKAKVGAVLELFESMNPETKGEFVEIIHGRENVLEMIDRQFKKTNSFYYATAGFKTNDSSLREEVKKMIDRGVSVCFMGSINSRNIWLAEKWAKIGVEVKHSAELERRVRFSVLDKKFASLTLKDEEYTTVVTNSQPIVLTLIDLFQWYWNKAIPLKERKAQLPEVSID
jgi:sugar-specific transcriptional regulator TrmB